MLVSAVAGGPGRLLGLINKSAFPPVKRHGNGDHRPYYGYGYRRYGWRY